jgi:hypothetical protein
MAYTRSMDWSPKPSDDFVKIGQDLKSEPPNFLQKKNEVSCYTIGQGAPELLGLCHLYFLGTKIIIFFTFYDWNILNLIKKSYNKIILCIVSNMYH